MLDPYTFGNSVASVMLAHDIDGIPSNIRRKVLTHVSEFNQGLNELSKIQDKTTKARLANLWVQDFLNHGLTTIVEYNDSLNDIMKNVISYRYRLWLEDAGFLNKQQLSDRKAKDFREMTKAKEWVKKNIP